MRDFKFYDKLYIGIEKNRYNNAETQRLLGFATPIDDTSAYVKRKETVDKWRDKTIEPVIVDNVPTFGFEIVDVVSRYRTDNKLYRIYDPRGFELEISAENLFDILMKNTLVKGKIMEPLLWARDGAKNYLVSSSCEEYQYHLAPKKDTPALAPGQYFHLKNNKSIIYRYEGRFYGVSLSVDKHTWNPSKTGYYHRYEILRHEKQKRGGIQTYVKFEQKQILKDPFEIYTEFHLSADDTVKAYKMHIRKSKLKDLVYHGDIHSNTSVTSFKVPTGKFLAQFQADLGTIEKVGPHAKWESLLLEYITNNYEYDPIIGRRELVLFKTKKEAENFPFTIQDAIELFKPSSIFAYNHGIYVEHEKDTSLGTLFYELFKNGNKIEEFE